MARNLHVVMVPWLAFGHMIPFVQLSVALARYGVRVSYVSTPRNVERLPQFPSNLSDLIKYVVLPLPKVEGLPEGAEATVDVTFDQIQYLKVAYDRLSQQFDHIIGLQSPNWIITDFAAHWLVGIAEKHETPLMLFSVFTAAVLDFIGPAEYLIGEGQRSVRSTPETMTLKPEWVPFHSSVAFQNYEAAKFHAGFYISNASGISDAERTYKLLQGIQAIAIRSCKEFEGEYIDLLNKIHQKAAIPAGVLPPEELQDSEELDTTWKEVFQWLNRKKPNSVVFVGFGSEYKLTKEEVYEIAYGLELSQLPFLWVLRKPVWFEKDSDALPLGFRERTTDRGNVCLGWAPQQKILSHPSIGGSLFHSGWGSIVETLHYGHIPVVLPFIIDQGLNARFLVEKELAIEVERREDGSFDRDDVAKALRTAMVEEEGERIRNCARKACEVFGDRKLHQEKYIGELVQYITESFQM